MSTNNSNNSLLVRTLKGTRASNSGRGTYLGALLSSACALLDHLSPWLIYFNSSELKARQHHAVCRTQNGITSWACHVS